MKKKVLLEPSLKNTVFILLLLGLFLTSTVYSASAAAIEVSSFYGKYDVSMKKGGQHALSLRGPKIEFWQPPERANKVYKIGVSFPHLKDSYWLAVNYGIMDEARKIGVEVVLLEAGGYTELAKQQQQLSELQKSGVDGIILGSISYTENNSLVAKLSAKGVPVLEVINDIEAQEISAKSLVSFYDMGFYAGEFVTEKSEAAAKGTVSVLFLPGPKGSGWADETVEGFKAAIEFSEVKIDILDVKWGDTGVKAQKALLEEGLAHYPNVNYIVGNAVAADVATDILTEKGLSADVISTYITPPVYDKIKSGRIAAAPADMTVDQARIAVGMMVRILNGDTAGEDFPFRAGPLIPVISSANVAEFSFERLFGPRNFVPIFRVAP